MTLYRTYRPQHFGDLIGQEAVAQTLQQALLKGRIAQAYLFTGPRGTGKTSTARIFARAICCLTPVKTDRSFEACGTCEACALLLAGMTPDCIEIDAASNRGIEDIRDIREQTNYPPLQLSRKIYIIDEVHMLSGDAFNALLKTLEEPPAQCMFILATTELHKVPLTIRSRCQLMRFERASEPSLTQKLSSIVSQEGLSVEPEAVALIAAHADGAFRDAETMLESLSTQHSPLTADEVRGALGLLAEEQVTALLDSLLNQDKVLTIDVLRNYYLNLGTSLERTIAQLINGLRHRIYSTGTTPTRLAGYTLEQLLEAYILQKSSPVSGLSLEIACLNICDYQINTIRVDPQPISQGALIKPVSPLEVAPKEYRQPEAPITLEVTEVTTSDVSPTVPVVEFDPEQVRDIRKAWRLMIEEVCRDNMILGQVLKDGIFHTVENGIITINVRFKFHAEKLNEKKNRQLIHEILAKLTSSEWEVSYVVTSVAPKRQPAKSLLDGTADVTAVFGKPS